MLATHLSRAVFKLCHGNQLVYNTCWEDPRLDRVALELGPGDRLLVITSAGCNALDYALDEPERIDTVDVNARQNALLDLKLAAIRHLDHDQFFQLFGRGKSSDWSAIYTDALRAELPEASRKFWDKNGKFFLGQGRRPSFYFRGSAGSFASGINWYINRFTNVRDDIERMLDADTIEEQAEVYFSRVKPAFWGPKIRWVLRRDATLATLGVPRAQRQQLERYYPGGIATFIEHSLDTVCSKLPLKDNYFWRVYLTGEYTPECCPEYLKPDNFARLKGTDGQPGLASRVHTHTTTILDHLKGADGNYSHFVLLDHMDWMAEHMRDVLDLQWQEIIDRADDGARILWRSAAVTCEFVDPIRVRVDGKLRTLGEVLEYNRALADELHQKDRVHTYGGFSIATLRKDGLSEEAIAQNQSDSRTGYAAGGRVSNNGQHSENGKHGGDSSAQNAVSPDALANSR
ncbi:MAG: BtaA family protein [Planctomycetota bacterium]